MTDRTTFSDLGIPFPLFAASAQEALEYCGQSTCAACGERVKHCFSVYNADPPDQIACYDCLRAGIVVICKDTVVGFVNGEGAEQGLTDAVGIPKDKLLASGLQVIPHRLEPHLNWHHVCVPQEHLRELVRTPSFKTWQGCLWLFCCQRPMVYVGTWKEPEFEKHAGNRNPASFFNDIMTDVEPQDFTWGEHVPLEICGGPYVFQCPSCGRFRGYHDMP